MDKKKIITLCLVVCLIVTAVAGVSLAYFTDTKSAENTFTLGNVKIELLESSLHRENAGMDPSDESLSGNRLWSNVERLGSGKDRSEYQAGSAYYTDDQIKENAKTYKNEKISLLPGQYYHKMPYVLNTGDNDAYVRIRVMIPAAADDVTIESQFTGTATRNGEFIAGNNGADNNAWPTKMYTTKDGSYNVYEYVRVKPLAPGEMTYWNVWGDVGIYATATEADMEDTGIADGFTVLVEADAIQAAGFEKAEDAWAAFDKQMNPDTGDTNP